ncbi:hypothetical protein ACWJJH_02020 [Endozoicomonadaceae bacterium StTr2]
MLLGAYLGMCRKEGAWLRFHQENSDFPSAPVLELDHHVVPVMAEAARRTTELNEIEFGFRYGITETLDLVPSSELFRGEVEGGSVTFERADEADRYRLVGSFHTHPAMTRNGLLITGQIFSMQDMLNCLKHRIKYLGNVCAEMVWSEADNQLFMTVLRFQSKLKSALIEQHYSHDVIKQSIRDQIGSSETFPLEDDWELLQPSKKDLYLMGKYDVWVEERARQLRKGCIYLAETMSFDLYEAHCSLAMLSGGEKIIFQLISRPAVSG